MFTYRHVVPHKIEAVSNVSCSNHRGLQYLGIMHALSEATEIQKLLSQHPQLQVVVLRNQFMDLSHTVRVSSLRSFEAAEAPFQFLGVAGGPVRWTVSLHSTAIPFPSECWPEMRMFGARTYILPGG